MRCLMLIQSTIVSGRLYKPGLEPQGTAFRAKRTLLVAVKLPVQKGILADGRYSLQ